MNRVSLVLSGMVVSLLAGCATTVAGTATGPTSTSTTPAIPPGLDTGTFRTEPAIIRQGDGDAAWTAEGNRMLENVVLPRDLTPH